MMDRMTVRHPVAAKAAINRAGIEHPVAAKAAINRADIKHPVAASRHPVAAAHLRGASTTQPVPTGPASQNAVQPTPYKKGGAVKGCGQAKKGTRKARMY